MTVDEERLRDALPTWVTVLVTDTRVVVRSPTFGLDGMTIEGRDVEEVTQRVRNVERIWALALDRQGNKPVNWPSAGISEVARPKGKTSRHQARDLPTGDVCNFCGGITTRAGMCAVCLTCGETTGCS